MGTVTKRKRRAAERRTKCTRCDWAYWQEPLTDAQGRYVDQAGERITPKGSPEARAKKVAKLLAKGKSLDEATEKVNAIVPIMVWRESGDPCDTCAESQFRSLRDNTCADGRCQGPRDCERHAHLYEVPPLEALGTVDEAGNKAVMLASDCTVVADMIAAMMLEDGTLTYEDAATMMDPSGKPVARCRGCYGAFHYPAPDETLADGTKKIAAYHRGDDAYVAKKLLRRPQKAKKVKVKTASEGDEKPFEEMSFDEKLSALLSEDGRLDIMARRCLKEQAEAGTRAGSYGEGLFGPVSLDIDPEARLAALDLAKLVAEQQADQEDDEQEVDVTDWSSYDPEKDNTDMSSYDDEDDGRAARRQGHGSDEEGDDEGFDLGALL
jgi:hypothetical protein